MAWRAVVISLSVRGVRDVAWISTFMLSPLFGLELFSPSAFFSLSNGVGRRPRPRPWDPAPRFAGRPLLICGSEVVSMYTIQGILVGIIVFAGGLGSYVSGSRIKVINWVWHGFYSYFLVYRGNRGKQFVHGIGNGLVSCDWFWLRVVRILGWGSDSAPVNQMKR